MQNLVAICSTPRRQAQLDKSSVQKALAFKCDELENILEFLKTRALFSAVVALFEATQSN